MNRIEEKIFQHNFQKYILQADGEQKINTNLLKSDAMKSDAELLDFLYVHFQDMFFKNLSNGMVVFEKEKFLDFISFKNFLSDSYTKFANKIALCDNSGESIAQNTDVVLVFPFKDCVLEGGASKDDEKKKEIFFNQILANEEIDRLFSPKALQNFAYITQDDTKLSIKDDIAQIPALFAPSCAKSDVAPPPPKNFLIYCSKAIIS